MAGYRRRRCVLAKTHCCPTNFILSLIYSLYHRDGCSKFTGKVNGRETELHDLGQLCYRHTFRSRNGMASGRLCDDTKKKKNYHNFNIGRITFQIRLQVSHQPLIHSHTPPPHCGTIMTLI